MMCRPHSGSRRVQRIIAGAAASFLAAFAWSIHNEAALPGEALVAAQAPSAIYQDVYNGWKWWHVYCYRCHGTNAIATSLAPSLIDPNVKRTSRDFLKVVREGVPDKGMQAWDKLLDDKQIGQIYLYVRARTDNVLPAGRPDEVGPNGGLWVPPAGWPGK
jgi:mono/diheme cytochrome c family protein